ncbi:MAG: hypothetical protein BWY71_00437 [Planctomycetes bacterium ADurb.Bin412]|nr:MAG: hypothetical protein BWY71_00437 [Planctomycetes bacterium ADurb.Bin412]
MLEDHAVPEEGVVVAERAVENPPFAQGAYPTDGIIRFAGTQIRDLIGGRIAHVQAHQDAGIFPQLHLFDAIDFIADLEVFPFKRLHDGVFGIVDFKGPGAVGRPGMAVKDAAHHLRRFRPVVKIIGGGMNANDPFAAFDKIHQALAQFGIIKGQPHGIVEQHPIKLIQAVRLEHVHIRAGGYGKSAGLLAHDLQGLLHIGDGTVLEAQGQAEHQQLARLGRLDAGLVRRGLFDLLDFFRRNGPSGPGQNIQTY